MPQRIVGVVRAAGEQLTAPLTGRGCVHWRLQLQGGIGLVLLDVTHGVDFFVYARGGVRALVRGMQARVAGATEHAVELENPDQLEVQLPAAALGVLRAGNLARRTWMRVVERCVFDGDEVRAEGRASVEVDLSPRRGGGHRELPEVEVLQRSLDAALVVTVLRAAR